jgi:SAM-dependent methyltransferase
MMSNAQNKPKETWASGEAYEPYVGRWSRVIAPQFLTWLAIPAASRWLDVGCGTGALTQTILNLANPAHVKGIDRSEGYIAYAKQHVPDQRAQFEVGDAQALSVESGSYDAAVSGLVLNFVPQPATLVAEMARATKAGGTVAAYVWDYADGMQFTRYFWDTVNVVDPAAANLDQGRRFPICNPQTLTELFQAGNLANVEARAIDIETHFKDFDDYWTPFLGGQGAAPTYVASLDEDQRIVLREYLRRALPVAADGSIPLTARAWAVRGIHHQ